LIIVDGIAYCWVVQPDENYRLGIFVECANAPGQKMVTWVDQNSGISPWLVKKVIHIKSG
jgi:hypothetical protein